jgi:phage shock protein A
VRWLAVQLGLVEEAEDPREALDLAHARQLELRARARRAVTDVLTARKRIELRTRHLRPAVARLDGRARAALEEGRQEEARDALTWHTTLSGELAELDRQAAVLAEEEARLRQAASRLDLQLQQLRLRREALRAGHAAGAAAALREAHRGGDELAPALEEAERRLAGTRARVDVAEELIRMEEELLWGPAAREQREVPTEERG